MKILIIDDEILIQQSFSYAAQKRGHLCQTAGNGETGLEIWKSWKPQLVFLDLVLPDANGISLMEQASSTDSSVVLMSAYRHFREKALKKGACLFLVKPFENIFQTFDNVIQSLDSQNPVLEL